MHNKEFDIAKNLKYDGYERGLASVAYKCFVVLKIKISQTKN